MLSKITGFAVVLAIASSILSCSKEQTTKGPITVGTGTTTTTTNTLDTVGKPYKLVWSDEFNGTSVDTSKWNFETGNLGVNNEKEYYQASNATVANGNLMITAKLQSVDGFPYTSVRMNTLKKFSAQFGLIQARIKIPLGAGLWPAFWSMGANINTVSWPQCGEMDIMEHINADSVIYGTMHWNGGNGHVQYGSQTTTSPSNYHIYSIEWDQNAIRWYVDNTLYQTGNISNGINNTGAFQLPFFLLLNLAVAGDFPGQTVDQSKFPATMYVDYVHFYSR